MHLVAPLGPMSQRVRTKRDLSKLVKHCDTKGKRTKETCQCDDEEGSDRRRGSKSTEARPRLQLVSPGGIQDMISGLAAAFIFLERRSSRHTKDNRPTSIIPQ
jgi:hypothetical protein